MTLGFAGGPPERRCRLCNRALHPELLAPLAVPYLGSSPQEACPECSEDWRDAGWRLGLPQLAERGRPAYAWPGPSAADLAAAEGPLAAALAGYVEARARLEALRVEPAVAAHLASAEPARPLAQLWLREPSLATLARERAPEVERALVRAWEECDEGLPSYTFQSELHGRLVALYALLTLELGERAPKSYGPRSKGPAALLDELRSQARSNPALRDPRVPLIRALLYREEGNLGGVDRLLGEAEEWSSEARPEGAFALAGARCARAREQGAWLKARDALKLMVRLRPEDPTLFARLASAYLACAQPKVAREVLAARTSDVREAAVRELVDASLRELKPQLEARQAEDAALRRTYAACLLGLGEADEAWRVLAGSELLETLPDADMDEDALEAEAAERLALAARAAEGRGQRAAALRLAAAAWRGRTGALQLRRDLIALLLAELGERLEELELETRPMAAALQAARAEGDAGEEERLTQELGAALASEEQGLPGLHALIRAHAAALLAETSDYERAALAGFLGRELGAGFRPLVTPPGISDRADLRVSDGRLRLDLCYLALAKRRLPDAVREERAARGATSHGTPLRLLLAYLELARRGERIGHALAVQAWSQLPLRRPPLEVGLLYVPAEAVRAREVGFLAELFEDPTRASSAGRPALRQLAGRCRLVLEVGGPLAGLNRDPELRAFFRALRDACPAFPYLLDLSDEVQFQLYFGCLASPEALEEGRLLRGDASVLAEVRVALTALRELAETLGAKATELWQPLLDALPEEARETLSKDV